MRNPFANIMFTDSVKRTQIENGTRAANERLEAVDRLDEFTAREAWFIGERDGSTGPECLQSIARTERAGPDLGYVRSVAECKSSPELRNFDGGPRQ